ncbi:MAG: prolyl oligopeptidase family serine peptidase [Candidatus Omnitrophica bacterium]|nr:prolyl oligopeptidase family serine peptidase [Candidatus Omnitrophota bacterium]
MRIFFCGMDDVKKFSNCRVFLFTAFLLIGISAPASWGDAQNAPDEASFDHCLVVGRVVESGRTPLHKDVIEEQLISGQWTPPREGQTILGLGGAESAWTSLQAGEDGWFQDRALRRGGYAYMSYQSDCDRVMLLDASGHNQVYVNGVLRTGDRYGSGMTLLPVPLRAGRNDFLFLCSRGRLKAKLVTPHSPVLLSQRDNTLPDLVVGETTDAWAAMLVVNASSKTLKGLSIRASGNEIDPTVTAVFDILPYSIRKTAFRLRGEAPAEESETIVNVKLIRETSDRFETIDGASIELRVRRSDQSQKRTFISDIDGSVQYYALQPAILPDDAQSPPALFLTLHGASVEAIGQADAYSRKSWGHIVAPTNRRPYGFDWEDWGRMDAMEVLNRAQEALRTDPQRTYLTGHSMGGHGAWQIGAQFPDRFAAIGPSAGWISFWSYVIRRGSEEPTIMDDFLLRAAAASDTLRLSRNYLHHGVYILHGDADDNVPVSEARDMREHLQAFHRDLDGHEEPGAGHWWDRSDEPGADCVDWRPMFDFFARHRIPRDCEIREIEFSTANPGVSSRSHWLTILAQIHPLQTSTVHVHFDPGMRRFVGNTENVAWLALDLNHVDKNAALQVELDGDVISGIVCSAEDPVLHLKREEDRWTVADRPDSWQKGPHRYGPFKQAFRHRMVFVYGTQGDPEENAWALAKARLDAEEFWYRGNGSIDVIPDAEFEADRYPDRNIILYGGADANGAWSSLLAESPVQVRKGAIQLGGRVLNGEDLCCLFVRPRPGSDFASVAVVSGNGLKGMRLTDRLPYFVSGVGYPDCIVMGSDALTHGSEGVRAAGFFGLDWSVESGEFVWKN